MKQLTVISGKGGTGKTTLVASFAALAEGKVLADCDVDAADLHLVLDPEEQQRETFIGGRAPHLDPEICVECGECRERCRFDAVTEEYRIDSVACEGCGLCATVCPVDAIEMRSVEVGEWFVSDTPSRGGRGGGRGTGRGARSGQGRGMGGGTNPGAGPGGNCVCPSCGATTPHQVGAPCYQVACPQCGTRMVRP